MPNTYSSSLLTQKLEEAATTVLQAKLAPLSAFTKGFTTDEYKPRATCQLKFVTATSSTQKNPTDFESGDSTVSNVQIAVDQYSQAFHVSNDELNSGLRLENLANINAAVFGKTIMDVVFTLLTSGNYNVGVTRGSTAFAFSDTATAWGLLKKSSLKTAILDGDYMARVINTPVFYQRTDTGDGSGFQAFGWDGLHHVSDFSAAEANVRGFFCNPQAVGAVSGLPLRTMSPTLETKVVQLEDLGLSVALSSWFSLSSRTMWASYDVMFGASVLDTTAGYLLKSA
jgi:hypothetical protein